MVVIAINGKRASREFSNMAGALAFAVNSGECKRAQSLQFAYEAPAPSGAMKAESSVDTKPSDNSVLEEKTQSAEVVALASESAVANVAASGKAKGRPARNAVAGNGAA